MWLVFDTPLNNKITDCWIINLDDIREIKVYKSNTIKKIDIYLVSKNYAKTYTLYSNHTDYEDLALKTYENLAKALGSNKQVIYSSEICVYGG